MCSFVKHLSIFLSNPSQVFGKAQSAEIICAMWRCDKERGIKVNVHITTILSDEH
jgi:hypothetical protein